MRNLKKLLAVVVSICVLATFTIPAFAEAKTEIQICQDLGMVQGTTGGVTDAYKASTPTRYQAAIIFLRLKGLEDEATAFIPTDNFSDLKGLNETNKAIIGYLKANPSLGFEGIGNNKFDPLKPMTAKEYYKVLLTALGYKEGTDFLWANVFQFAAGKGLYALVDNTKFTINDLAIGTVEALKTNVKGGTTTLLTALVDSGAIASDKAVATGFYTAPAQTLEVSSATADTLKTAVIGFNKELDSNTVKKENFVGDHGITDAILLADKKSVVVVLTTAKTKNSETEEITIKNVKTADGKLTIAETKKTVTFNDVTAPGVTGASAKNAKTIVITATEPLNAASTMYKTFDDIKIDGSVVRVSKADVDFGKNTLTLNLVTKLSVGAHKIEIAKLVDFANLTAPAQTYSFEVVADTTAPVMTSAKMNNLKEIEVTFNEDLDPLAAGSFKVNGNEAKIKPGSISGAKVTLTLTSDLNIGATVEVVVKYKNQKDVEGNEVTTEQSFSFKVPDDTTLPTVTASIATSNEITLTFSKDVIKDGTIKVYDKDNKQVSGFDFGTIDWESASCVKIAADKLKLQDYDAGNISIKISDVKDASIRSNGLAETTIALKANDTKEPDVKDSYTVDDKKNTDPKDDTITFYFSEAMDQDTLKNLANYYVVTPAGTTYTSAKALNAYSDVSIDSVASDGKSVTIKAKGIAVAPTPTFQVYAMKDVAGNMLKTGNVALASTTAPALDTTAGKGVKATEKNKIEVYFTQDLAKANAGSFILREADTVSSTVAAYVVDAAIDGKKVTLTLDREIGTKTDKAYLQVVTVDGTENVYGTKMTSFTAIQATDAIKPTVTFSATKSGIIVEFTENVTTTAAGFVNEVQLTKDGTPVVIDSTTSVSALNGSLNAGTTKILIKGLKPTTEYKIQLYPRATTKDLFGNEFVATEVKAVTTEE